MGARSGPFALLPAVLSAHTGGCGALPGAPLAYAQRLGTLSARAKCCCSRSSEAAGVRKPLKPNRVTVVTVVAVAAAVVAGVAAAGVAGVAAGRSSDS